MESGGHWELDQVAWDPTAVAATTGAAAAGAGAAGSNQGLISTTSDDEKKMTATCKARGCNKNQLVFGGRPHLLLTRTVSQVPGCGLVVTGSRGTLAMRYKLCSQHIRGDVQIRGAMQRFCHKYDILLGPRTRRPPRRQSSAREGPPSGRGRALRPEARAACPLPRAHCPRRPAPRLVCARCFSFHGLDAFKGSNNSCTRSLALLSERRKQKRKRDGAAGSAAGSPPPEAAAAAGTLGGEGSMEGNQAGDAFDDWLLSVEESVLEEAAMSPPGESAGTDSGAGSPKPSSADCGADGGPPAPPADGMVAFLQARAACASVRRRRRSPFPGRAPRARAAAGGLRRLPAPRPAQPCWAEPSALRLKQSPAAAAGGGLDARLEVVVGRRDRGCRAPAGAPCRAATRAVHG